MKRCIILAASPDKDYGELLMPLKSDDYVICADGGYIHAQRLNIEPDLLVGDFDSLLSEDVTAENIKRFSTHKDYTDMAIAVKEGISLGYDCFELYGGIGGRLDHTLANIAILLDLSLDGKKACLVNSHTRVIVVTNETVILSKENSTVSVFAVGETNPIVTLKGFEYPLNRYEMCQRTALGISNEFSEKSATVTVENGSVAIMIIDKNHTF